MEDITMKKTYINPELEVVKLQTMQMLAASLILDDDPSNYVTDDSEILGRESDFDFEDDLNEFEDFE